MNRSLFGKMSLKIKIMGLMLGLTLLLGVSASILVNRLAKTSKESILETFATYSSSLQAAIAAQFYERYGDVQAFALNPGLQSRNREEIVDFLNKYSVMYGIYDLIMVVDANGKLVAVNNQGPDGKPIKVEGLYAKNFGEAPWFKAVMKGQFTDDKERGYEGTYIEDAHVDPSVSEVFGEKRFGTSFSAPIKNAKGEVIGLVTNRAGSRWFEAEFVNLYGSMKKAGLGNSELTLIDKDGTVLVDYDPSLHGGNTEIVHDFTVVGNLNLVRAGLDIATKIHEGQQGKLISMHARKKTEQATGYMPITDKKFIPSIGWGVIVRSSAADAFASVLFMERFFYVTFTILALLGAVAAIFFSGSLAKTLKSLADRLGAGAGEVFTNSKQVAGASASLSSSTTEQAAALQETTASVDEVSAMISKNAENARKSQDASAVSQAAVEKGKRVVDEMVRSIEEINQSNSEIMQQIETSNHEISEIVKVINEIGTKTKVINDIVFQTKLLSFNASVEAARAGEHGKGFAVVAEEVGNLAQMSGNAAKEISSLLDGSIQKVENIVTETKTRVTQLVSVGKQKVETGTTNAKRCGEVFDEVVQNVNTVNQMIVEIATACREQAQGVEEITKAMNQLDEVTQQNANSSQLCSGASDQLRDQADNLTVIVQTLLTTVQGHAEEDPRPNPSSDPESRDPSNKVLSFRKKPKADFSGYAKDTRTKKVVGGDPLVPSEDDPRFKDV